MVNYAEWRVHPRDGQRSGRHSTTVVARRGAAIAMTGAVDDLGRAKVGFAATGAPKKGQVGIADFVEIMQGGTDELRGLYRTQKRAVGDDIQMCAGGELKMAYTNTADVTMVDGTLAVGAYVTPVASPNDDDGYFVVTATAADAWGTITAVNGTSCEVRFGNF